MAESNSILNIIVRLQDEASREVKNLNGTLKDMAPQFKAITAAGVAGFAAVSGVIYKSVEAAGEAARVQSQLEAVLKSTHGAAGLYIEDLNDQARALQRLTTYGDEAINSAQSLLLTFTNIKGGVFQESIGTILDMSTALGQDLKSSATQVGKALNDPINGVTALQRVGVSFTDAQKEVIEKLVETGKTAEAQRLILKELNTEFGGSATAAAQNFSGQMEQLKNLMGDLAEEIGKSLVPIINELVSAMKPALDKAIEWAAENPELVKTILLGTAAFSGLLIVFGTIGLALPAIISGFTAVAGAILAILSPVGLVIAAIIGLQLWFVYLANNSEKASQLVLKSWTYVADNFVAAWELVKTNLASIWEAIKQVFKAATDYIMSLLSPLLDAISSVISGARSVGKYVGSNLSAAGQIIGSNISAAAHAIGFANGGIVTRPTLGLVGEAGPEAIIPLSRAGGFGGVTLNIYGDVSGEDLIQKVKDGIMRELSGDTKISLSS